MFCFYFYEDLIDDTLHSPYSREDKSLKDLKGKRLHLSLSKLQNKVGVLKSLIKNRKPKKLYARICPGCGMRHNGKVQAGVHP